MSRERNFQTRALSFAAAGGAGAVRAVERPRQQQRPAGRISLGEARRRASESAERAESARREYAEHDARRWADYKADE